MFINSLAPVYVILQRLRRDGLGRVLSLAAGRLNTLAHSLVEDARRGVSTTREVADDVLGFQNPQCHAYVATDYEVFDTAIRHIRIRAMEDVFVDFGSGKGRAVLLAAEHPFRRVIGVEFSRQLHDIAGRNLRSARNRVCQDVELVWTDATQWVVPVDATVLFFFNPFEGEVLAKVCDNVRQSLAKSPRQITIIYVRADKFFEKEIAWEEWLTRTQEFPYSDGKVAIYQSKFAG